MQLLEGGIRGGAFPLKDGENAIGRENGDIEALIRTGKWRTVAEANNFILLEQIR